MAENGVKEFRRRIKKNERGIERSKEKTKRDKISYIKLKNEISSFNLKNVSFLALISSYRIV